MTPEERTTLEARLAELRPKLLHDWEFIDDGALHRAQREIAREIQGIERQLKQG